MWTTQTKTNLFLSHFIIGQLFKKYLLTVSEPWSVLLLNEKSRETATLKSCLHAASLNMLLDAQSHSQCKTHLKTAAVEKFLICSIQIHEIVTVQAWKLINFMKFIITHFFSLHITRKTFFLNILKISTFQIFHQIIK